MIDLIPGLQFSDTEKQVYGSIAGAVIGAILGALAGALSTFIIANRERNKQDELQKIQQNRTFIRNSATSLQSIEFAITDLLIKCEANNEYARDIQKGLTTKDNDAGRLLALMQLSTPFEYPKPDSIHTQNILNDRIVTLWGNLCQEVELQNKNISDFAEFYKMLLGTIHSSLLREEKIDVSVVESDSETIKRGMEQQLTANMQLRTKCLNLLALVDCFKDFIMDTDARDVKTLKEYRSYIEAMAAYMPTDDELNIAFSNEDKTFDPLIMFKSKSTGDK